MISKEEDTVFQEYLRWKNNKGKDAPQPQLVFHAHLKNNEPLMLSALGINSAHEYHDKGDATL